MPLKKVKLTAYDAMSPTDEFVVPLTYADIMKRLEGVDTVSITTTNTSLRIS